MVDSPFPRLWGWWRWLPPSASAICDVGLNCPHRHCPMSGQEQQLCQQSCRGGSLLVGPKEGGMRRVHGRNVFHQHSRLQEEGICLDLNTKTPGLDHVCVPHSEHVRHSFNVSEVFHIDEMVM